jgi:hypothetical protein
MASYDPSLTFDANARALNENRSPGKESDISRALKDAYEDGWHDARAKQLAGLEISECPDKW